MLTENTNVAHLAVLLVRNEAILFEYLRSNLPDGWVLDWRAKPE